MYGCDKVSLFGCLTITATQDRIMYTRQQEIARGIFILNHQKCNIECGGEGHTLNYVNKVNTELMEVMV